MDYDEAVKRTFYLVGCLIIKLLVCISIYAIGIKIAEEISPIVFTNSGTGMYFIAFIVGVLWSATHRFLCKIIKRHDE